MAITLTLGLLTGLSLCLTIWQWLAARRFPLHQLDPAAGNQPGVTLFKPLKGCDEHTVRCLESWFQQDYRGPIQVLLGVASEQDPACAPVQRLLATHAQVEARLVVCPNVLGVNGKVSTLIQLHRLARHNVLVVSDADVQVPAHLLAQAVLPLRDPQVGLVHCFYRLGHATTWAMRWEAFAVNADFWSQVLQGQTLWPLDYALGAVMVTPRAHLEKIGGFESLANFLADDYQLGHRLARNGARIELCPIVVDCWSPPLGWRQVWRHQLRWARTIRMSKPAPYAASLLSNATLWPALWFGFHPTVIAGAVFAACLGFRLATGMNLLKRMTRQPSPWHLLWLIPLKDVLQVFLWLMAFTGQRVEWKGVPYRIRRGGQFVKASTTIDKPEDMKK
jgi:ceramide glucosyltransferase